MSSTLEHPTATRAPAPLATKRRASSLAAAALRATRPKQWTKNVLILAAPAAAGVLGHPGVAWRVAGMVASFVLLASGTYLVNDVMDAGYDRRHPTKRLRPVASGEIPASAAIFLGGVLVVAGLGAAAAVSLGALLIALGYIALTTAYSLLLKSIVLLDLVAVAGAYVIRAAAGGVAAAVPLSRWFLLVVCFGSLFLVAGKRHGERLALGAELAARTRRTLSVYSASALRYLWMGAALVALAAYTGWAFSQRQHVAIPFHELSIVPVGAGVIRYGWLLEEGAGGAPEDLILRDRALVCLALVWAALFAAGVYVGR